MSGLSDDTEVESGLPKRMSANLPKWALPMFFVAGLAALNILWLATIFVYLSYDNFTDHIEATVSNISLLFSRGAEIYPNPSQQLYGLLYGPFLYIVNALPRLACSSIVSAQACHDNIILIEKLPGVAAYGFAYSAAYAIAYNASRSHLVSLFSLSAFVCMGNLCTTVDFPHIAYWNRSEPFLLCISAFALLAALKLPPKNAIILLGLLAGFASGFKIHGAVYIVPSAVMALTRSESIKSCLRYIIFAAIICIATILAPFALSNVSLSGYLQYLSLASHHHFDSEKMIDSILFLIELIVLALFAMGLSGKTLSKSYVAYAGALIFASAMTILPASKEGAGAHHMLPFAPHFLYLVSFAISFESSRQTASNALARLLFVAVIVVLPALAFRFYAVYLRTAELIRDSAAVSEQRRSLEDLASRYPGVAMAPGTSSNYSAYYHSPVLTDLGSPLIVDAGAYMDLERAGMNAHPLEESLSACRNEYWVAPGDKPWTVKSYYSNDSLFSQDIIELFKRKYATIEVSTTYTVWKCRRR
jgi:hypothetical protein